jgi:hypothetical protein
VIDAQIYDKVLFWFGEEGLAEKGTFNRSRFRGFAHSLLEANLRAQTKPASTQPAAGETWFVKLPGAIALTELRVREATPLTVLVSVNGDWRDTRYAIADLTWAEKKA